MRFVNKILRLAGRDNGEFLKGYELYKMEVQRDRGLTQSIPGKNMIQLEIRIK